MTRFTAPPPPPPFKGVFVNKRPHFHKRPHSNIIILEYGYALTEVHLPLIAHKRTVMPHYHSGLRLNIHRIFVTVTVSVIVPF